MSAYSPLSSVIAPRPSTPVPLISTIVFCSTAPRPLSLEAESFVLRSMVAPSLTTMRVSLLPTESIVAPSPSFRTPLFTVTVSGAANPAPLTSSVPAPFFSTVVASIFAAPRSV